MYELLLKHGLFLKHLDNSLCGDAFVDLREQPSTEDAHVFVHGSDFDAEDFDQVVGSFCRVHVSSVLRWVVFALFLSILQAGQVCASFDHQLVDELLHFLMRVEGETDLFCRLALADGCFALTGRLLCPLACWIYWLTY